MKSCLLKFQRWKKASIFAYGLSIAGVNKQKTTSQIWPVLVNKVLLEHSHAPSFTIAACVLQYQSSYHGNHMACKAKNIYYLALYVEHPCFPVGLFFLNHYARLSSKAISFNSLISPPTLKRNGFLTCVHHAISIPQYVSYYTALYIFTFISSSPPPQELSFIHI